MRLFIVATLAALLGFASAARAHPALGTIVECRVTPEGVVEVFVVHDTLAYALNDTSARVTDEQMYALLDGPPEDLAAALQDGRERFAGGFEILADGERMAMEVVASPTVEFVDAWKADNPAMRLPVTGEFQVRASLPLGTSNLSIRAPHVFDQVMLSVARPGRETVYIPLARAETSPPLDVSMASPAPAAVAGERAAPSVAKGDSIYAAAVFWRYLVLGYRHIVPEGHDHELFILGLFLINTKLKDVLWQVTAFTIAHTCSLTLATFGLVSAPSAIVEPIIAASIAFIAVENLCTKEVHPWRLAVAFVFGLVHGLGFASGLLEIGLPTAELVSALIAFNIGVEAGHLTILAAAFLAFGWFREKDWYRARISIPLSVVIAGIALFWFVERVV